MSGPFFLAHAPATQASVAEVSTLIICCDKSLDCPEINLTLEHGHMNGSGSSFGSTYSFYCDEGYKIDGQSTVFCDEQGQWNATIPVCSRGK